MINIRIIGFVLLAFVYVLPLINSFRLFRISENLFVRGSQYLTNLTNINYELLLNGPLYLFLNVIVAYFAVFKIYKRQCKLSYAMLWILTLWVAVQDALGVIYHLQQVPQLKTNLFIYFPIIVTVGSFLGLILIYPYVRSSIAQLGQTGEKIVPKSLVILLVVINIVLLLLTLKIAGPVLIKFYANYFTAVNAVNNPTSQFLVLAKVFEHYSAVNIIGQALMTFPLLYFVWREKNKVAIFLLVCIYLLVLSNFM